MRASAFGLLTATLLSAAGALSPAAAQAQSASSAAAPAAQQQPAIQPQALALLRAMSDRLAAARSMSFSVRRSFEEVGANGQPLVYFIGSNVSLVRPDRLKIITPGDGPPSELYFDGKELTVFMPKEGLAAVLPASANIESMLEAAYTKAGFYLPFVDFIVAKPYESITERLTGAFVMGKSTQVGGVSTDVVSISNPDFHAQIWIGSDDKLPRLATIVPAPGQVKPRNTLEFSNWKINQVAAGESFRSNAAGKAKRIEFASPVATAATTK